MSVFFVIFSFSFCVIFIVEVYTVLMKVYIVFLGEKVGGMKRAGLNHLYGGKWFRRQRHRRCLKWPPSAWTQASSRVRHWSMASSTTVCWNSRHVSISRCRNCTTSRTGVLYTYTLYLIHSLLHHTPDAVVHRFHIRAVIGSAHVRSVELWSLAAQRFDRLTSTVCTVLLEDEHVSSNAANSKSPTCLGSTTEDWGRGHR